MAYNTATNVRPTIWYRTGTGAIMNFQTYNAALGISVPTEASGNIPPMQAFWVKVDTDPIVPETVSEGTLKFTNTMRSHDESATGNPLKAPSTNKKELIRLSVSNGSLADETVIVAHPSASDSFDQYDSEKMSNNDVNRPEIYSKVAKQELVINGVSEFIDGKQFTLGFRPGKTGNFSIALTEWNAASDVDLVLIDKAENTEWILTIHNPYNFTSDATTTDSRFSLIYRNKGSITDSDHISTNLSVYAIPSKLFVQSADLIGANVSVINTMGQILYQVQAQSNTLNIDHAFVPGVYIVKVNNEIRKISLK